MNQEIEKLKNERNERLKKLDKILDKELNNDILQADGDYDLEYRKVIKWYLEELSKIKEKYNTQK